MRTRQDNRKQISLPGRFSTGLGEPRDVVLRDLSCGGCRIEVPSAQIAPGAPLQIYVGQTGPHRAVVRWAKDGELGLSFRTPLSEQQFSSFQASHIPDSADQNPSAAFEELADMTPQRFC